MKKTFSIIFIFIAAFSHAQQKIAQTQKFALVIGNGNYANTAKLNNPVNDANDMAAALQGLGFTVDKVVNGTQEQMVNAVMELKKRLGASKKSYGFLFYAGHGIQSNGENYLIPVDAAIPTENFLRSRAVSVQEMLNELNDARNEFNVVVLDACRDNPFGWKRSGSRGLVIVSQQPADSIIVYATSAGSVASDGTGRNGLFTQHLLNNLKTPDIEVTELFRRTGADVAKASGNMQRPAAYNQFFGIAYLGTAPAGTVRPASQPLPNSAPQPAQTPAESAAQAHLEKAKPFYGRKEFDAAIQELTEAIKTNPRFAEAFYYRGNAYMYQKDYDRAIADYGELIKLHPRYAAAYFNRGIAYRTKNDNDRAIADYSDAINMDLRDADVYYNRGNAYLSKNLYDSAITDYTEAIRLNPQYATA
jgi:tetratricopeptide (TPR) repeat protein